MYELTPYGKSLIENQAARDSKNGASRPTPVWAKVGNSRINLRNATQAQLKKLHDGKGSQSAASQIVQLSEKKQKTTKTNQLESKPADKK